MQPLFKKILIANRAEIACRIMKTAQQMGIHCVAIYSSADKDSLHVHQADSAFYVGEAQVQQSYLNMEYTIHAPHDGLLNAVFYEIGAQVHEGAELLRIG